MGQTFTWTGEHFCSSTKSPAEGDKVWSQCFFGWKVFLSGDVLKKKKDMTRAVRGHTGISLTQQVSQKQSVCVCVICNVPQTESCLVISRKWDDDILKQWLKNFQLSKKHDNQTTKSRRSTSFVDLADKKGGFWNYQKYHLSKVFCHTGAAKPRLCIWRVSGELKT